MVSDYSKLVEDLRDIEKTMFALGTSPINMDNVSIRLAYDKRWGPTANDAADAIEALQAEQKKTVTQIFGEEQQEWEEYCGGLMSLIRELKAQLTAATAEIEELKDMPWVESVQIDKLRQRIDELEEKQTYCDAYGDKWMTSGKDVPTEAYKHGYADGWDEARAKMDGPIITPCRGCSDYDGYGGCRSEGGCSMAKMEVQE